MTINAEIQNLKEENEMLRSEINRLRNELNELKRSELREVVGDAKPEAPIYGYLNE
jgi:cell division protein FtsB